MSKTIVGSGKNIHAVIWQDAEDGPGEPAAVIKYYDGSLLIEIKQESSEVLLNHSSIPALIRELRKLHKEAMSTVVGT